MSHYSQYVGIVAGLLTGISLLPQLFKIIKEKKANSISFGMLVVLLGGLCVWILYGILQQDYPVIITNSFSLMTNIVIVILTRKYKEANIIAKQVFKKIGRAAGGPVGSLVTYFLKNYSNLTFLLTKRIR